MAGRNRKSTSAQTELHVGDRVRFRYVFTDVEAVITEDRGRLGVGGRQLWGVRFPWGEEEYYLELPTERLERIEATAGSH